MLKYKLVLGLGLLSSLVIVVILMNYIIDLKEDKDKELLNILYLNNNIDNR